MTTTEYLPDKGLLVTIYGPEEGLSVLLPATMSVGAIERHIKELEEWLQDAPSKPWSYVSEL